MVCGCPTARRSAWKGVWRGEIDTQSRRVVCGSRLFRLVLRGLRSRVASRGVRQLGERIGKFICQRVVLIERHGASWKRVELHRKRI